MQYITRRSIQKLLDDDDSSSAVTIYLPTHKSPSPPHITEDQTRFKNLFKLALDSLARRGSDEDFSREFAAQCSDLLEDITFWEHQTASLFVCARPSQFLTFNLPLDSEEYVAVDDHYHLTPVFGLAYDLQSYNVLLLAQHEPKLLRGTMYGLADADLTLPKSIEALLQIDEMHQRSTQFHSISGGSGAQYHGHGGAKDSGEPERLRFFRQLDDVIMASSAAKQPLLLAGVDHEVTEYRQKSRHPRLLEASLSGNFTSTGLDELFPLVWKIIQQELIESRHTSLLRRFRRLAGERPELAVTKLSAVKEAAERGRIHTLLVGMSQRTRDTIRDNKLPVPKLHFPERAINRSLDYVARRVWDKSGTVVNLDGAQLPENTPVLAILRY